MNEKVIRNLGIALLVLLALYGILRWQQNRSYEPAKPAGFNFEAITAKNTKTIEVKSATDKYKLIKKNGKWQLKKREVDQAAIEAVFTGLKNATIAQIAATTKVKLVSLQVDDQSGKQVTFTTNKDRFTFIMGKQGMDGNSFYIRLPKEQKAYQASGTLGAAFAKKASDWYKKASK